MFDELMNANWEEFARYIFHVEVEIEGGNGDQAGGPWSQGANASSTGSLNYAGGTAADQPSALAAAAAGAAQAGAAVGAGGEAALADPNAPGEEVGLVAQVEQRKLDEHDKVGRNDPCWCGSGKKFKKCHGA